MRKEGRGRALSIGGPLPTPCHRSTGGAGPSALLGLSLHFQGRWPKAFPGPRMGRLGWKAGGLDRSALSLGTWSAEPCPTRVALNWGQPSLTAWPKCGHETWVQKQDTLKDHWPGPRDEPRQLGRAAGPVPGSGRPGSEGGPQSCMLPQGNPQLQAHLQSRAGLDPGLPWQRLLEPSRAEPFSPVTPRLPGLVG